MGYDFSFEREAEDADDPLDAARGELHFNIWAMAWMREVMRRADVLTDEPSAMPAWPPAGMNEGDTELAEILLDLSRVVSDTCDLYGFGLRVDAPSALLRAVCGLLREPPPSAILDRLATDLDAAEAARSATGGDPSKVPGYKFESNEGWLVTPAECRSLAAGLRAALEGRGDALFPTGIVTDAVIEELTASLHLEGQEGFQPSIDEARESALAWIDYNERAAAHGGYRVT
jgi:hypothetical protein